MKISNDKIMKRFNTYLIVSVLTGSLSAQTSQNFISVAMVPEIDTKLYIDALSGKTDASMVQTEQLKDYDGNIYNVVKIGTQIWMASNLKTTHYRNGDAITLTSDNTAWKSTATGAYCNYENDEKITQTYGRLYNYFAIVDKRNLCPANWHVPTDADWATLGSYLGGDPIAGAKITEKGTDHWNSPNSLATNETGFTALPAGIRSKIGEYGSLGNNGCFWSSSEASSSAAWFRELLYHDKTYILRASINKEYGFSVRCIKD